jgi:hypothetical protein
MEIKWDYKKENASEVAFPGQPIWKFLGSRLVEARIHGKVGATETEIVEIYISFAVLP